MIYLHKDKCEKIDKKEKKKEDSESDLLLFKIFSLNSLWKHIAIHWQKSLRKYLTKTLDRKKVYFYRFFFMSCRFMKTQIF